MYGETANKLVSPLSYLSMPTLNSTFSYAGFIYCKAHCTLYLSY